MRLRVNPRLVTEILSRGQYSHLRTVIAEYVANAWDADASRVSINLPKAPGEPITVEDDGEGIDLEAFSEVARDRQSFNRKFTRSGRPVIGNKGVGRWSGFAFTDRLIFVTRRDGVETELVIEKKDLTAASDLYEYDLPETRTPTDLSTGTKVVLYPTQSKFHIGPQELMTDLMLEFSYDPDFAISVNGMLISREELPGRVIELLSESPVFGPARGFLHVTDARRTKRPPGVIVRVRGRRVVGPSFFGVEEDFPKRVFEKITGDVNVDSLQDAVVSGREAFLEWDDRYKALKGWLYSQISDVAISVQQEGSADVVSEIMDLPEIRSRFVALPDYVRDTYRRTIEGLAPKLGRIRKDKPLLTMFGVLLLRAVQNVDFHQILQNLQNTDPEDISNLARVLEQWGFGEIARAAALIQERIHVLEKFAQMVQNDETLELQHIHAVLAHNTWILDDKYSLFSSNKQLRSVAVQLGQKYAGSDGADRPDLILKRDRRDFVLIELKRPRDPITLPHATQILSYATALRAMYQGMRDVDLYLIGRQFEPSVTDNFRPGNPQRLHLTTLRDVVEDAHDRLKWLLNEFSEERVAAEHVLAQIETSEGDVS